MEMAPAGPGAHINGSVITQGDGELDSQRLGAAPASS